MTGAPRPPTPATVPLLEWVWRSYLRASLAPLLVVEVLIVTVYLVANRSATAQNQSAVRALAEAELGRLASREAGVVQEQLAAIARSTDLFRRQSERAIVTPFDPGPAERARYAYTPDGVAWHTIRDDGGAAVYYSGVVPVGEAEREKALRLSQLDPLMRDLKRTQPIVVQVYFNTHDSMNRLYPYFEPVGQLPPRMDIPTYNFYYLADAAHDPTRAVVWTGVYVDPVGKGWMTSAIAPVYRGDFLEGVVGLDVTVGTITRAVLDLPIPWDGYGVLIGEDGTLLAMPAAGEADFGLVELTDHSYDQAIGKDTFKPDTFNLFKRQGLETLAARLAAPSGLAAVSLGGPRLAAWATIPETGWKLLIVVPEDRIDAAARKVGAQMLSIGVWMIGGLVAFYAVFLAILYRRARTMARSISAPLQAMDALVARIAAGDHDQQAPSFPVAELETTVGGVVEMGRRLGRALAAANDSTRIKGEFLANVSHELRTPLNTIVNVPDWLLESFPLERGARCAACETTFELEAGERVDQHARCPECGVVGRLASADVRRFDGDPIEVAEHLTAVRRSGKHLLDVVDQVLEMSKAESGQMRARKESLDAGAIVARALSTLAPIAARSGVRLLHSATPGITLDADPVKLAQILINLVGNAVKFSPDGGVVEVRVEARPRAVRFSVHDEGIGIAPENHSMIFESFRQVDGGATRRYGGTGLGLAITKKLVELHGGTVWVESALFRGSTFHVELPRGAAQTVPPASRGTRRTQRPTGLAVLG